MKQSFTTEAQRGEAATKRGAGKGTACHALTCIRINGTWPR
ncbi:MAG TPA: hypothetical protein VGA84_07505 [Thermoanaerobaculia bacterium]